MTRGFILIGFIALVLFGIGALQHEIAWLGTTLVIYGILGLVLEIAGMAIPAFVYFGTATIGLSMLFGPATKL